MEIFPLRIVLSLLFLSSFFLACSFKEKGDYYSLDELVLDSQDFSPRALLTYDSSLSLKNEKDSIAEDDVLAIISFDERFIDITYQRISQAKLTFRGKTHELAGLSLKEALVNLEASSHEKLLLAYHERLSTWVELYSQDFYQRLPIDDESYLDDLLLRLPLAANRELLLKRDKKQFLLDKDSLGSVLLKRGDSIYLAQPRELRFQVLGDVKEPLDLALLAPLSLKEALDQAGSFLEPKAKHSIYIERNAYPFKKHYRLRFYSKNLVEQLLLFPSDKVYVKQDKLFEV